MKAIVHIGLPKCGSTTVQRWLVENSKRLREQGILYDRCRTIPESRKYPNQNIEMLLGASACAGRIIAPPQLRSELQLETHRDVERELRVYQAKLDSLIHVQGYRLTVFSSEFLAGFLRTIEDIKALDRWLKQRFSSVCYVAYLKNPANLLLSQYAEHVRNGGVLHIADFVQKRGRSGLRKFCETWTDAVGSENIDLRLLDKKFLFEGDLIADFGALIGADIDASFVSPPPQRVSLGLATLIELRWLNQYLKEHMLPADAERARKRILSAILKEPLSSPKAVFTADLATALARKNAKLIDWLVQHHFPDDRRALEDVRIAQASEAAIWENECDARDRALARLDGLPQSLKRWRK